MAGLWIANPQVEVFSGPSSDMQLTTHRPAPLRYLPYWMDKALLG